MAKFVSHDGTRIDYDVRGDGSPVVLLHGFASTRTINWERPGVVDALTGAGFRTIAMDHRGHGASDKPHEPAAYEDGALAGDVRTLLDEISVDRCDVVGFSLGALVLLRLLPEEPRIRAAVLGGVGENVLTDPDPDERRAIADALLAEDKDAIEDRTARSFRDFADLTGADRQALAALQRARRDERYEVPDLATISCPVLIVCGDRDDLAGDPSVLAERIGGARAEIVGGTHLNVVNNPAFHETIVGFLREQEER